MLSKEAFIAKYRPHLLLHVTEAWAIRKEQPSGLGIALDRHHLQIVRLLEQMHADLTPKTEPVTGAKK